MKPISPNTVIPNPCFIGVRDLLVANYEKQIPHRLRRIRNDMMYRLRRLQNDMPHDVRR